MIRGTTPTHAFRIPFDKSLISEAMVIYSQNDAEVFNKKTEHCTFNGDLLCVTLTQEETLSLKCRYSVQIQLRVLLKDGTAMATPPYTMPIEKCLNDEVLK